VRDAYKAGAIVAVGQPVALSLQVATNVVLARILAPTDFGLVSMATAISGFGLVFRDIGLGTVTIQRQSLSDQQVSNLFWVNAACGTAMMLLIAAIAWPASWIYGDRRVTDLILTTSSIFFVAGLSVQHTALLKKEMRFAAVVMADLVSLTISSVGAVSLAIITESYWSLILVSVARPTLNMFGIWFINRWRPKAFERGHRTKELVYSGLNIVGFDAINYWSRNFDNIVVGRFLGAEALGVYSKGYELLLLPLSQLRAPVTAVALPTLSRHHAIPEQLATRYLRVVGALAFMSSTVIALTLLSAEWLIPTLLGVKWNGVVHVFHYLAPVAVLQTTGGTLGLLLLSTGRSRRYLKWGTCHAGVMIASFMIGINWGLEGILTCYIAANVLVYLPSAWYCTLETGVRFGFFINHSLVPVAVCAGAFGLSLLAKRALHDLNCDPVFQILISAAVLVSLMAIHLVSAKHRYELLTAVYHRVFSSVTVSRQHQDFACDPGPR
jgi:O-antigen/teichoic acid export membrane protein